MEHVAGKPVMHGPHEFHGIVLRFSVSLPPLAPCIKLSALGQEADAYTTDMATFL